MTGPAEPSTFTEPWEARTFAMVKELQDRGVLARSDWAEALGEQIRCAEQAPDGGDAVSSFHLWLAALERIVVDKRLASSDALDRRRQAWAHAAHRTPHGQPITLAADDVHN